MKTLPLEASDQEILDAVREWVELLIEERYTDAYEFLSHEKSPNNWTPELIAALIHNYGSPEPRDGNEIFKVTSLEDAKVDPPKYMPLRHDVHRYRDDDPEDFVWLLEAGCKIRMGNGSGAFSVKRPRGGIMRNEYERIPILSP